MEVLLSATVSIHSTFLEREILTHAMPPVLMCSDQWPLKFGEVQIAFESETVNSLFCIRIEIVFSTCFESQAAFISTGPKSPVGRCHRATVHLGEMLFACHWSHLNLIPLGGSQRAQVLPSHLHVRSSVPSHDLRHPIHPGWPGYAMVLVGSKVIQSVLSHYSSSSWRSSSVAAEVQKQLTLGSWRLVEPDPIVAHLLFLSKMHNCTTH